MIIFIILGDHPVAEAEPDAAPRVVPLVPGAYIIAYDITLYYSLLYNMI